MQPGNFDLQRALVDELHRAEEDALYSSKAHFNAAERWKSLNYVLGVPAAVISGLAGASALSQFDHHNVVAGVLSLGVAALTAVVTFLNPSEQAAIHKGFGSRYNTLKNQCRVAGSVDSGRISNDELRQRLEELSAERDQLGMDAPGIPRWAFVKARKGIEQGEAQYEVDQGGGDNGTNR